MTKHLTMKSLNSRLKRLGFGGEVSNKYSPGCEVKGGGFVYRYYLDEGGFDNLTAVEEAIERRELLASLR